MLAFFDNCIFLTLIRLSFFVRKPFDLIVTSMDPDASVPIAYAEAMLDRSSRALSMLDGSLRYITITNTKCMIII